MNTIEKTIYVTNLLDKIGNLSSKAWTELYIGDGIYGSKTQFHSIIEGKNTLLKLRPLLEDMIKSLDFI